MSSGYQKHPEGLPVPIDDGAADHLVGSEVPHAHLPSTIGGHLDLAEATSGIVVVYVYPRTGKPDEPLTEGWDSIRGGVAVHHRAAPSETMFAISLPTTPR
jgi:hypothetical protein